MIRPHSPAFTLIELLVVITIIVVLLAMLTPALDKAIYQAELAVCSARLKTIGGSVTIYAADHRRRYPYRPRARAGSNARPEELRIVAPVPEPYDDRPTIEPYLSINKNMQCPLCKPVNLETQNPLTQVFSNYQFWYGWQYVDGSSGNAGMFKLGDAFGLDGDRFNVLAADTDFHDGNAYVQAAHPDREGGTTNESREDTFSGFGNYTESFWIGIPGTIDRSFVLADNSAHAIRGLLDNGENTQHGEAGQRLIRIPTRSGVTNEPNQSTFLPTR